MKVCGVTLVADAGHCVRRRVGYVGFNFYRGSKRYIAPAAAAAVWRAAISGVPAGALATAAVAVVVGATALEVGEALAEFPELAAVQVHAAHGVDRSYLQELRSVLGPRELWLALPVATSAEVAAAAAFSAYAELLLFDSAVVPQGATVAGGSGVSFDWSALLVYPQGRPYAVAGGLGPSNIGALAIAVRPTRPLLVDLCSGVEVAPGVKDHGLIDAVLRAVGGAW